MLVLSDLFLVVVFLLVLSKVPVKSIGSMSAFIGFQGLRLVFHGSRSVFIGFQGSRLIFQGFRLVFHGSRLVFTVPDVFNGYS